MTRDPLVRPPLIRSIQVSRERCPQLHGLGKRYGAPSGIVVRVPRVSDPKFAERRVNRPRARRETSVYTDEASSSLLAFTGHEAPAGGPAVRVLPADASPALEAALWAVRAPRGNRDLQHAVDESRIDASRPVAIRGRATATNSSANAQVEHAPPATIVLVCDAPGRAVTTEEARAKSEELACPFLETSAKTSTNVEEAFLTLASELLRRAPVEPQKKKRLSLAASAKEKGRKCCS